VTVTNSPDINYDPYDFEIDKDPYPLWKRMRDDVPLYYNEKYDFFALSRYEDVDRCLLDWGTYSSGRGSILELIRADFEIPSGIILFEDPPIHDIHRQLLSRVFTPRKMNDLESKVRAFTADALDPIVGTGRFDFIADLGVQMPMRTIGMLLGIPEQDQVAIRDQLDEGLRLEEGKENALIEKGMEGGAEMFAEYIDWRVDHPSDDLMTELLTAQFEDETGTTRTLTREEVLNFVNLLAGAGNETTARLIGWAGKVLADHPDQRRALAEDRSLVPNAIEELLRYESPSPVQARLVLQDVEHYGQSIPEGSVMVLLNGSANRDDRRFENGDQFDIHRDIGRHLAFGFGIHLCLGAALARLEGRVALDEVLKRFPEWEIDYEHAVQGRTSTVRGWESLPVFIP
jgi:cytochrome P450